VGEEEKARPRCRGCGAEIPLDGTVKAEGELWCPRCAVERAERYIAEKEEKAPPRPRLRDTRAWRVTLGVVVLLCLVVAALQAPRVMEAMKPTKPLRLGTYETDAVADACLNNLWKAAALLQGGKTPPADLRCPATGRPYLVTRRDGQVEVRCPDPAAHGLKGLWASDRQPLPVVVK